MWMFSVEKTSEKTSSTAVKVEVTVSLDKKLEERR